VAGSVAGGQPRVVKTRPGHAYVSVRGLDGRGGPELARAVESAVSSMRGVRWAQVNPVLASVIVAFEDGEVGLDDVAGVVDSVEEAHGRPGGSDPYGCEHPADPAPITRAVTALAADALGIGVGAVGGGGPPHCRWSWRAS
jgi:copper chaperone CopZ